MLVPAEKKSGWRLKFFARGAEGRETTAAYQTAVVTDELKNMGVEHLQHQS
jgi:hypothetical protein